MKLYKLNQIMNVVVDESQSDKKVIRYRPLLESAYYSPGVIVEKTEDGIRIGVVRCGIKSDCNVTVNSSKDENGLDMIEVDVTDGDSVYFTDHDGEIKIYPG